MIEKKRLSLPQYVATRLIYLAVVIAASYSIALLLIPLEYQTTLFHILFFILALSLFFILMYLGSKRISKELKVIKELLAQENTFHEQEDRDDFFSKEFKNIHLEIHSILRKIKKKDKKKQKYTAKIKLKNRQRSNMLSAIAHEFRNPIAAIMGYAQTLNDDDEIPPILRKKFLSKVYNNGEKIEELLSRLLLWNRFESGEQKLQLSGIEMYPLIKEVASSLQEKYRNRQINIEKSVLKVKADRALMEIVIKNLIENALKYSKGVVEVKIKGEQILVVDQGVGISPENIEKVTKKFFRTDEHSWDNSMGLGLAIVKQILKLHNSTLQIESEEHRGSTFSFSLR